jgi:hypothetical protein
MMRSPFLVSLVIAVAALGAGCVVSAGPARPAEAHAMRNGFAYLGERLVNGGARIIQRVDFRYGNLVAGTQAKVELWGR